MTAESLFKEFSKLNRQEKKHFLDQVLNSFLAKKEAPSDPTSLSDEQIKEVVARIEAIKSKTAKTYSWEEVKAYATSKNV